MITTEPRDFAQTIGSLLADTTDSVSHLTALYFLGFVPTPPEVATIVSSGRRRHRTGGEVQVQFIYHPGKQPRDVQQVVFGDTEITTATVEQALVDLVTDWRYAPPLDELGGLFARLPYDMPRLIELARETADVSLKRVLFWLFWCGRAGTAEVSLRLSRTPAKLAPDADRLPSNWLGRLYMKYPQAVLGFEVPTGPKNLPPAVADWIELRRYAPFRAFLARHNWLPIRDDSAAKDIHCIDMFLQDELDRAVADDLGSLLAALVPRPASSGTGSAFPRRFVSWARERTATLPRQYPAIRAWTAANLRATDAETLEAALFWATHVGLQTEALTRMGEAGRILFQSHRCAPVPLLYTWARRHKKPISVGASVLYSRVLVQDGRLDEALEVIDAARAVAGASNRVATSPPRPGSSRAKAGRLTPDAATPGAAMLGELAFNAAIIHRHARRFDEAIAELVSARQFFMQTGDRLRVRAVEVATGNVFWARGALKDARRSYLTALALDRSKADPAFLANVLTNLGLVEFKAGRFDRACQHLARSAKRHADAGNPLGESVSLVTHGKARLATGQMSQAVRLFRDALSRQERLGETAAQLETVALLAWTFELLGKGGAAANWWNRLPADLAGLPTTSAFLIRFYLALKQLLYGDFSTAGKTFAALVQVGREHALPADEIALMRFYQALAQMHDDPRRSVASLREVLNMVAHLGDHCLHLQVQGSAWLMFPESFAEVAGDPVEPDRVLSALLAKQYYDPLWFLLVNGLSHHDLPSAQALLHWYWRMTPADLRVLLAERFANLRRPFKVFDRRESAPVRTSFWKNGAVQPQTRAEYDAWVSSTDRRGLRFDGPSGRLSFSGRATVIRPGSYPYRVLTQLLMALPEPIPLPVMFRAVWGSDYDPECDWPAIKATMVRLRRQLERVTSAVRLDYEPADTGPGRFALHVGCAWEAAL